VIVSDSSYRNIEGTALFIQSVWGDVTITGMDIRHVTNSAIYVGCKILYNFFIFFLASLIILIRSMKSNVILMSIYIMMLLFY